MNEVTITIDRLPIRAEEGMTVLQAAQANGLYIPNLCAHPDLDPAGLCRVCVVKMDDWKVVIACKQTVKDGMVIETEDPEVQQIRKNSVELLLAYHPMTCLTCEADSNCELQRVAHYVGIRPEDMKRYRRSLRPIPMDTSNPFFDIDHAKCILCGICIRTCDEINGVSAIDFAQRGVNTKVATLGDKPIAESVCESCGECVERCPVGALARKGNVLPAAWEVKTSCPYCGVGCGIYLCVRGDKIVSARGDSDSPVNKGQLCVKGRFGHDFVNHPDRLTTPLIKRDGEFVEADWDEALDLIATKFTEVQEKHGPEALAGLSSARVTNEDNYLFQKLLRSLGTNSVDHCARL